MNFKIRFLQIFLLLMVGQLSAQVIEGTVRDSSQIPLPGANVIVKGTTTGVITDFDGNFRLENVTEGSDIEFSFVGMITKTIEYVGQERIDIILQSDPNALDEVVLVGYGRQKKISVVGAQTTLDPEELEQPVANMSTMLAGRVSGLTGVQRSGLPGYDGADIWIRGISTFTNAGTSPLVLVDGVERSMSNIDPRNIESFSILKDAAATAVYGIRGANGVILIETKKGEIGKPAVSIDYNEGVTFFTQVPDLMDGVSYMNLANEALTTRGQFPLYSQETIDNTANNIDPLLYPNVNWLDEVFNDYGRNRLASANVSGGAEDAKYYVSLGYYDETGLFVTDGLQNYDSQTRFKRYSVTSNLTVNITKTTKANLGVQGYVSEGNYPAVWNTDLFTAALRTTPVEYPVLYPGDTIPGRLTNGNLPNPYAEVTRRGFRNENKNQLYSNLRLTQDLGMLTEGLSWTGMFAFDTYNQHQIFRTKRESTYFPDQQNPYNEDGTLNLVETYTGENYLSFSHYNGGNRRFYLETSFNYDQSFGKNQIGALLLFNRSDYVDAFAGDFTNSLPYRNQGLAGRVTYSYDDRYFAEFNGGYNGSENFAPENRYGFFPSMAFGWVVSNEEFFEPLKNTIDYLKIRYSDGKVGASSGAGRFAYLSRVEAGQAGFSFGQNVQGTGGIAETFNGVDVTWAESRKQDLGLELNAFDSSLKLVIDLFREYTEGAFLERGDLPNYIGLISAPYGNLGIVENKGFDGTLRYNKNFGDLSLSFRGTFSYNKNKIIENGQPEQPYEWLNRQGSSLTARYGYVAERLFVLQDDTNGDGFIDDNDDGKFPAQFGQVQPGDIKYKDLNGDGLIDSYDQQEIGRGNIPALTYGFGLSSQYKNFDTSLFFQGQSMADILIGGEAIMPFSRNEGKGNLYSIAVDRWTPENNNPYAYYPRLSYGAGGIGQTNNLQSSTWWQRKVNFLRLKTAEIGYTFGDKVQQNLSVDNLRLYLRATNLLTFTNFDLWDPELDTSNGVSYPNVSVYSLGFNLQF